jgi:hypothetical protein
MTHLTNGQLRAHLDHELENDEARHLRTCGDCRARLAVIDETRAAAANSLGRLQPQPGDPALAARPALARFQEYAHAREQKEKVPMLTKLFSRFRPLAIGLTVIALAAVALSFPTVRAWAGQFLGLFRVQQITVLPIDTSRLSALTNDDTLGQQISQLFSDSVNILQEPGEPTVAASAEAASQLAGFQVRELSGQGAAQITVQGGTAFEITVDRARAQAVLNEASSDLQLPASLDGATIKVEIPAGVSLAYGACPDLAAAEGEAREGLSWRELSQCLILAQIPSPTVTTPPDLDVQQLAELGLQFMGLTPEEARDFSQSVDWTSTLVVPIPRNAASVAQVAVDGVTGTVLSRSSDDGVPARYTLLWVKNGIIYSIAGFGDAQTGVALANSLK